MVERNELITVCRQVGGMMEAGVDILRITRVLRQQTDNPRLLQLYDALDHDMTMGHGLADAMSHAPDVFSPFMVLMVQQGEARNDLAGSFFKIADYIQKDGELSPENSHDVSLQTGEADVSALSNRVLDSRMSAPTAPLTVIALDGLIDRLQTFALRSLTVASGLLLSLAGVWWSVEMKWLERQWAYPTMFSVAAIFMGSSGILIQRRIKAERRREARCSFCGRPGTDGDELQRAPRFAGAAICSRCAKIASQQTEDEANQAQSAKLLSDTETDAKIADAKVVDTKVANANVASETHAESETENSETDSHVAPIGTVADFQNATSVSASNVAASKNVAANVSKESAAKNDVQQSSTRLSQQNGAASHANGAASSEEDFE